MRQFCVALLYGDRDIGEDFTDLPDVNSRKNKSAITVRFELSPCFHSCYIADLRNEEYTPNLCQPLPTCATCFHFLEIHCRITDYVFLCGKRNT